MSRLFFRKHQRIAGNEEFRNVLSHHCCTGRGYVRVYAWHSPTDYNRFGVSISKRYGTAVERNRFKRIAREAFRLEQHNLPSPFDYLLIFGRQKTKKRGGAGHEHLCWRVEDISPLFFELASRSAEKARSRAENQG